MQKHFPSRFTGLGNGAAPAFSVAWMGGSCRFPRRTVGLCHRTPFSLPSNLPSHRTAHTHCPPLPPDTGCMRSKGARVQERLSNPSVSRCRVRLVERGSPHSLPLMESGKVSIPGRSMHFCVRMSLCGRVLKFSCYFIEYCFHSVFLNVVYQDSVWP